MIDHDLRKVCKSVCKYTHVDGDWVIVDTDMNMHFFIVSSCWDYSRVAALFAIAVARTRLCAPDSSHIIIVIN